MLNSILVGQRRKNSVHSDHSPTRHDPLANTRLHRNPLSTSTKQYYLIAEREHRFPQHFYLFARPWTLLLHTTYNKSIASTTKTKILQTTQTILDFLPVYVHPRSLIPSGRVCHSGARSGVVRRRGTLEEPLLILPAFLIRLPRKLRGVHRSADNISTSSYNTRPPLCTGSGRTRPRRAGLSQKHVVSRLPNDVSPQRSSDAVPHPHVFHGLRLDPRCSHGVGTKSTTNLNFLFGESQPCRWDPSAGYRRSQILLGLVYVYRYSSEQKL